MIFSLPINRKQEKDILIFFLFYFLLSTNLFAQDNSFVDSLKNILLQIPDNTNKVDLLNDIAWEYKVDAPEKARTHLSSSLLLATQLNYKKGEAQAYNNLGVVETIHGYYNKATANYQKALKLREELKDRKGVASLYNNIGNIQEELGNYVIALDNLKKSLRIRKELKDTARIARCSYNISLVYEAMGNHTEALDYILSHLAYSEKIKDKYEIANAHNVLGNIKTELERFDEAIEHYEKSLTLREELGDQWELAMIYQNIGSAKDDFGEFFLKGENHNKSLTFFNEALNFYQKAQTIYQSLEDEEGKSATLNNIGLVYKNLGSYYLKLENPKKANEQLEEALVFLNRSLKICEANQDQKRKMEVLNGIGDVKRRQKKLKPALDYTHQYLAIAESLQDQKFQQQAYKDLSKVYEAMGAYKEAFSFRKKYDELRYKRLDEDRAKYNSRREAIYGDELKQQEIERQEKSLELQNVQLRNSNIIRNSLFGGALALLLLIGLLYNRYRLKHKANLSLAEKNEIIEKEKERSDHLLLNILPKETAEELKTYGKAKAKHYKSVSVLFTDFKSFTLVAEQWSAEELVAELDFCFRAFDEITAKYGIEKIKTIGDAYMCAGGIPTSNNSHAKDTINAALEIQAFMFELQRQRKVEGKLAFETRIGIHTGPVVAGIVGSRKFAYDIWGDTVNMAARMESSGSVGKVNISESTYQLVKNDFECIPRGKVKAKNKGEVDMYFVVS